MKIGDIVAELVQGKHVTTETITSLVEEFLLLAYKRTYEAENAVVVFGEEEKEVYLYSRKKVVEDGGVQNPIYEVELSPAVALYPEAVIGKEVLVPIDPTQFKRVAVQMARQKISGDLRILRQESLYEEYKTKIHQIVVGTCQIEKYGNFYVDLGNAQGYLPVRNQSKREHHQVGDRIKVVVQDVKKVGHDVQIILSRSSGQFVRRLFENEIAEIYEGIVLIKKIVRQAGYKTKLAVSSTRSEVDPVGTCVGPRGVRIQTIMRELEGEKIDVIPYSTNIKELITKSLVPAKVKEVYLADQYLRKALVVVEESQLPLAVGRGGMNVVLASRLVDWSLDIKLLSQVDVEQLSLLKQDSLVEMTTDSGEIEKIQDLPGLSPRVVDILQANGITLIETLSGLTEAELFQLEGLKEEDIYKILRTLDTTVESTEEEEASGDTTTLEMLPGLSSRIIAILKENNIATVEDLTETSQKALAEIDALSSKDVQEILRIIDENVEFVEDEE